MNEALAIATLFDPDDIAYALDRGLRPEWFEEPMCRAVVAFVIEHWQATEKLPSRRALSEKFPGWELPNPDDTSIVYQVDALRERRHRNIAQTLVGQAAEALGADPVGALRDLKECAAKYLEEVVESEATSWEPIDLGPYLRGEMQAVVPSVGMARDDGLRLLYPGKEHALIGLTESGKSWVALGCLRREIDAGNHVVYMHFEEADPGSTVERALALGMSPEGIAERLHFVAPDRIASPEWIDRLARTRPTLAILDGVNEALSLFGQEVNPTDGWSTFRRAAIRPFLAAGAAVLSLDHLPHPEKGGASTRVAALGTVHKGNALDGARFLLEANEAMGRNMRGTSRLYVTKDRPGHLRQHGQPGKVAGKVYLGMVAVDSSEAAATMLAIHPPNPLDPDIETAREAADHLGQTIILALRRHLGAGNPPPSGRELKGLVRNEGTQASNGVLDDKLDQLEMAGQITKSRGPRNSHLYRLSTDPPTDPQPSSENPQNDRPDDRSGD